MTLLEIHKFKTGKISDKWQSYLELYENLFQHLKYKNITLVELGIQNGGSLETWAEYFVNAEQIIGIDIDERCRKLSFNDKKIKTYIQDGKKSIPGNYDIIIDDASHLSNDIIEQFKNWFPFVKENGIYIVEDLHTMWMNNSHGSGAENFFANLINDVNRVFHDKKSYEIKHIEFHNSLVIIHKGPSILGERLICGTTKII